MTRSSKGFLVAGKPVVRIFENSKDFFYTNFSSRLVKKNWKMKLLEAIGRKMITFTKEQSLISQLEMGLLLSFTWRKTKKNMDASKWRGSFGRVAARNDRLESSCPFERVSRRLTKQFHVRAATRSDEFPWPLPPFCLPLSLFLSLCLPPVICSRGFARLALIAGQTRGTLRLLDNLLDDRLTGPCFLDVAGQLDGQWISWQVSQGVNWSFGSFHEW